MKKISRLAFFLFFAGVVQMSGANDAGLPHFKKHENYASVRTAMIKAGWTPFHINEADECMSGDARCAGRPEMAHCAGTGQANCQFLWKKNGKTAGICTVGENPAVYANVCNNF
jgi:hypothetical protein